MDYRVIRYYAGELNRDERRALLEEASANPELKREMMECQHLHTLTGLHPNLKDESAGRLGLERFVQRRRKTERRRISFGFLRYAAVVAVCVAATWWISSLRFSLSGDAQPVAQELTVPAGQRAHIVLPDGSKAWVNAGSTLSYPSVFGSERRVALSGEACFEVAKGERPFIVSTGKVDVRALGTQFNVFSYPGEELSVSLLEGSVRVYAPDRERQGVVLTPGQQLVETGGRFVVGNITDDPAMWREGLYAFDGQNLKEILRRLELYYDVKFVVTDPAILDYEYTGKFRQRDGVMEVLRIIQKIHPFKMERDEEKNEITLRR